MFSRYLPRGLSRKKVVAAAVVAAAAVRLIEP
jgi:hypothetical protein